MERTARHALLRFLLGLLHLLFVSLHRKTQWLRPSHLLGQRGWLVIAAGPAGAFRPGFSRAPGPLVPQTAPYLRSSGGLAAAACQRRRADAGLHALGRQRTFSRPNRIRLFGALFPGRGDHLSPQLSPRPQRGPPPATEMDYRRDLGWHTPVLPALYLAAVYRPPASMDGSVGSIAGPNSAVFWLRHHPLPADGRGRDFQARLGLYVCHWRRGRHLFCRRRADRRALPHRLAHRRPRQRDGHRSRCVLVPAVARLGASQAGPLLLSRPFGFPPHPDRIRSRPDQRSASRTAVGIGARSHLSNSISRPPGRLPRRSRESRSLRFGAV